MADAYRYREDDPRVARMLPAIPVVPISARDARRLLEDMKGDDVEDASWRGALEGVSYRYGRGHAHGERVRVATQHRTVVQPIHNVIAKIHGSDEPDRVVVIGNHRDAWAFGAADPNRHAAAVAAPVARVRR